MLERIKSWLGPEPASGVLLLIMGLPILGLMAFTFVVAIGGSLKETFQHPLEHKQEVAGLLLLALQVAAGLWFGLSAWLRRASSRALLGPGPELAGRPLAPPLAEAARSPCGRLRLDFLWRLRGSVPIDRRVTNQAALQEVENILRDQGRPISDAGTMHIAFDVSSASKDSGDGWGSMSQYDSGRFWIEHGPAGRNLRYELGSLNTFARAAFAAAISLALSEGGVLLAEELALIIAGAYAVHLLVALVLVPRLIRKAARAE